MAGSAWVTLATNDSYSLGALVLAHSLRKVNTVHQLAVLITPAVSPAMREQLSSAFDVVKIVDVLDSKDEANLALLKRPELGITFTKLHCWQLTQFEKGVFLDADTLVVRNCDELFEREEFSAAPDVGWPDCFNSGVFVFRPSVETYANLVQFAIDKGSFDGGDQGLLNQFFSSWATDDIRKHLPFVYNLTSVAVYSYIPAFKQYGADTRIVHFIGPIKPWLQPVDPATRTVTPQSESAHLQPLLQQWWDLFIEKVHPGLSANLDCASGMLPFFALPACSRDPLDLTLALSELPPPEPTAAPSFPEPYTPYIEVDDARQYNLPYQPFQVVSSEGELLNITYGDLARDSDQKETEYFENNENRFDEELKNQFTPEPEQGDVSQDNEVAPAPEEEKDEEQRVERFEEPLQENQFDYQRFVPDESCINAYLEHNFQEHQPHQHYHQQHNWSEGPPSTESIVNQPLPRFLTISEDDPRQSHKPFIREPSPERCNDYKHHEDQHQQSTDHSPPWETQQYLPPGDYMQPQSSQSEGRTGEIVCAPSLVIEPAAEAEPHCMERSKSMSNLVIDATNTSYFTTISSWKSQPEVNPETPKKLPGLKPLRPKMSSPAKVETMPKYTEFTEVNMVSEHSDPFGPPADQLGFVERAIMKRVQSRKAMFDIPQGALEPALPPVALPNTTPVVPHEINEYVDLSECKRQEGNIDTNLQEGTLEVNTDGLKVFTPKSSNRRERRGTRRMADKWKPPETSETTYDVDSILKKLSTLNTSYAPSSSAKVGPGTQTNGIKSDSVETCDFSKYRNYVASQTEVVEKGFAAFDDIIKDVGDPVQIALPVDKKLFLGASPQLENISQKVPIESLLPSSGTTDPIKLLPLKKTRRRNLSKTEKTSHKKGSKVELSGNFGPLSGNENSLNSDLPAFSQFEQNYISHPFAALPGESLSEMDGVVPEIIVCVPTPDELSNKDLDRTYVIESIGSHEIRTLPVSTSIEELNGSGEELKTSEVSNEVIEGISNINPGIKLVSGNSSEDTGDTTIQQMVSENGDGLFFEENSQNAMDSLSLKTMPEEKTSTDNNFDSPILTLRNDTEIDDVICNIENLSLSPALEASGDNFVSTEILNDTTQDSKETEIQNKYHKLRYSKLSSNTVNNNSIEPLQLSHTEIVAEKAEPKADQNNALQVQEPEAQGAVLENDHMKHCIESQKNSTSIKANIVEFIASKMGLQLRQGKKKNVSKQSNSKQYESLTVQESTISEKGETTDYQIHSLVQESTASEKSEITDNRIHSQVQESTTRGKGETTDNQIHSQVRELTTSQKGEKTDNKIRSQDELVEEPSKNAVVLSKQQKPVVGELLTEKTKGLNIQSANEAAELAWQKPSVIVTASPIRQVPPVANKAIDLAKVDRLVLENVEQGDAIPMSEVQNVHISEETLKFDLSKLVSDNDEVNFSNLETCTPSQIVEPLFVRNSDGYNPASIKPIISYAAAAKKDATTAPVIAPRESTAFQFMPMSNQKQKELKRPRKPIGSKRKSKPLPSTQYSEPCTSSTPQPIKYSKRKAEKPPVEFPANRFELLPADTPEPVERKKRASKRMKRFAAPSSIPDLSIPSSSQSESIVPNVEEDPQLYLPEPDDNPGIAGAIAQLSLEPGTGTSTGASAAQTEYLRRQSWETGKMDYMGRDSFANVWSKISETLSQEPLTEGERTSPRSSPAESRPVSLAMILDSDSIDTLPSDLTTSPGEAADDDVIFERSLEQNAGLPGILEEVEEAEEETSMVGKNDPIPAADSSSVLLPNLSKQALPQEPIRDVPNEEKALNILIQTSSVEPMQDAATQETPIALIEDSIIDVKSNQLTSQISLASESVSQLLKQDTTLDSSSQVMSNRDVQDFISEEESNILVPASQASSPDDISQTPNVLNKASPVTSQDPVGPEQTPSQNIPIEAKRVLDFDNKPEEGKSQNEVSVDIKESSVVLDVSLSFSEGIVKESINLDATASPAEDVSPINPTPENNNIIVTSEINSTVETSPNLPVADLTNNQPSVVPAKETCNQEMQGEPVTSIESIGHVSTIVPEVSTSGASDSERDTNNSPLNSLTSPGATATSASTNIGSENISAFAAYKPPLTPIKDSETTEAAAVKRQTSVEESKEKKGVFTKLLEFVGVVKKKEDIESSSVFYDEPYEQKTTSEEATGGVEGIQEILKSTDLAAIPYEALEKESSRRSPSPRVAIPSSNIPHTHVIEATPPTSPGQKPPRRDPEALTVDAEIPETPPVVEKKTPIFIEPEVEVRRSDIDRNEILAEIEGILSKAKLIAEDQLESVEPIYSNVSKKTSKVEIADLPKPAVLSDEFEEIRVTSEEERKRPKAHSGTSKLSGQILKAIPPPRRKAISDARVPPGPSVAVNVEKPLDIVSTAGSRSSTQTPVLAASVHSDSSLSTVPSPSPSPAPLTPSPPASECVPSLTPPPVPPRRRNRSKQRSNVELQTPPKRKAK